MDLVKGSFQPYIRKFLSPPVYDQSLSIGIKDKFFTKLRLYVQEANMQFPQVSIKLSLSNGTGKGCFCEVSIEELQKTIDFLQQCLPEITLLLPELKTKEEIVIAQLIETQRKLDAMQAIQQQIAQATQEQ